MIRVSLFFLAACILFLAFFYLSTLWSFICIAVCIILIATRYFIVSIKSVKARNTELVQQHDNLQIHVEELKEKEFKTKREIEQLNNAKRKLLASISHEIRTPMNGVIGMASFLAETNLNEEQREYNETILSCSKNLLSKVNDILISDMLDFSKIDSEKSQLDNKKFNLRNCIEEVLDMFAGKSAERRLDLVYQMDDNVPLQIVGDYKSLQQVLINLIENAVKFTPSGDVYLGVSLLKTTSTNQLELGFEVSDTGKGISENSANLFTGILPENYSTRNKQISPGFGLVICKKLVEMMGGEISAKNRPGKGASFTFNIRVNCSMQSPENHSAQNMLGFDGQNILIVDDNSTSSNILKNQLEKWNLLTVVADSGKNAIEILTQVSFDMVITDLNMPEMDGLQLGEHIKNQYPKIPVILLNAMNDDRYKQYSEIFESVLTKPVKQHILFDSILSGLRHKNKSAATEKSGPHKLTEEFAKLNPLHILIAEDNPVNQKWITKILKKMGYNFEVVSNGKIVLEVVGHEHFDLILMDVQMPEMDGLEATRMIRVCLDTQPVIIAMTANVMQGDREDCMQSGMDDYISKPVELNELANMLEKWSLSIKEKKQGSLQER